MDLVSTIYDQSSRENTKKMPCLLPKCARDPDPPVVEPAGTPTSAVSLAANQRLSQNCSWTSTAISISNEKTIQLEEGATIVVVRESEEGAIEKCGGK